MKERIENIKERIEQAKERSGREDAVKLVAVSKRKPAEMIVEAINSGAEIFGENYIQEALDKIETLKDYNVSWHFIGHLQSNKAKYAVKVFDLIHTVDSFKLANEIDKQAKKTGKIQDILVQLNISEEESKSGADVEEAQTIVKEISVLENVRIKGLMGMPPFFDDPDKARPYFEKLKEIKDKIASMNIEGIFMEELSMGMTGDFEVAVESGSTIVRVGTAIFGARL